MRVHRNNKPDAEIDANPIKKKAQTSIHTGATEEYDRLLVVLNVDGSSPSGHPSPKLLLIQYDEHRTSARIHIVARWCD